MVRKFLVHVLGSDPGIRVVGLARAGAGTYRRHRCFDRRPAGTPHLEGLPKAFPAPLLIVQHMATGFIRGFVEWLAQSIDLPVHVAIHGEPVLPGHVYVAAAATFVLPPDEMAAVLVNRVNLANHRGKQERDP